MSNRSAPADDGQEPPDRSGDADEPDYLEDVVDGIGCAEVWEHLSERRASD